MVDSSTPSLTRLDEGISFPLQSTESGHHLIGLGTPVIWDFQNNTHCLASGGRQIFPLSFHYKPFLSAGVEVPQVRVINQTAKIRYSYPVMVPNLLFLSPVFHTHCLRSGQQKNLQNIPRQRQKLPQDHIVLQRLRRSRI